MYAFETIVESKGSEARVLLVQAAAGESLAEVVERVRNDRPGEDPIIIRLAVDMPINPDVWTLPHDAAVRDMLGSPERLMGRTRSRSMYVLSSFDGEPYLTDALHTGNTLDELVGFDKREVLEQIREAEFNHLVVRSKALLAAPPGSRLRAPSGMIVSHFVRVGNIQADRDALDAVAFWALEHLRDRDAIVTDTWSISSIALNAARVAAEYFNRRAPRVEMLPGYNDGSDEAIASAQSVLERVAADVGHDPGQPTKVLVLVSATQSGGLVAHLGKACQSARAVIEPTFLALFALQKGPIPRLSEMVDDDRFAFARPGTDETSIIDIDPHVYFPLAYVDVAYRLGKKDAEKHRDFFDAYERTKVVRIHSNEDRQDPVPRHHAIRLDLGEIIQTPRFNGRLADALRTLGPQKAILAPLHNTGQHFAKLVARKLRTPANIPRILPIPASGTVPQADEWLDALNLLRSAKPADEFVILDDFSADISRIAQIDKLLRTIGFAGRINYIVGILTHDSPIEWSGFVRRLVGRGTLPPHTIQAIEHLPLPDIGRDGCPWCAEVDLYAKWTKDGHALPPTLDARRAMLTGADVPGLTDGVLLHPNELPPPALGPKSFYVRENATQAHVLCATSAAVQRLRIEGQPNMPKLGPRHYPIATVLDHEDYLEQKWTDTVLRASFLRTATIDELVWTDAATERKRRHSFTKLLRRNGNAEYDVVLEVLIAAACGKVTLDLTDQSLCKTIASRTQDGTAAYLVERLKEVSR